MIWKGLLPFAAGLFGIPKTWEACVCMHIHSLCEHCKVSGGFICCGHSIY